MHRLRAHDREARHGEVGQQWSERRLRRDDDGQGVLCLDATDQRRVVEASEQRCVRAIAIGAGRAVQRVRHQSCPLEVEHHRGRVEVGPVVELHAAPQGERPGPAVRRHGPALGELRHDLEAARLVVHEGFEDLSCHEEGVRIVRVPRVESRRVGGERDAERAAHLGGAGRRRCRRAGARHRGDLTRGERKDGRGEDEAHRHGAS